MCIRDRYNAVFYKSKYSLVDSRQVNVYENNEDKFGVRGEKALYKETVLFDLLINDEILVGQSIIYCSSPNRVRKLAKRFSEYLIQKNAPKSQNTYLITEWLEKNIAQDWSLLKNLQFDIGIHNGALQKHITTSIIDYFNQGKLRFLF